MGKNPRKITITADAYVVLNRIRRDAADANPFMTTQALYTHPHWYEYRLRIRYAYANRTYLKTVIFDWEQGELPKGCKLDVTFYHHAPQQILYIHPRHNPYMQSLIDNIRRRFFTHHV